METDLYTGLFPFQDINVHAHTMLFFTVAIIELLQPFYYALRQQHPKEQGPETGPYGKDDK